MLLECLEYLAREAEALLGCYCSDTGILCGGDYGETGSHHARGLSITSFNDGIGHSVIWAIMLFSPQAACDEGVLT